MYQPAQAPLLGPASKLGSQGLAAAAVYPALADQRRHFCVSASTGPSARTASTRQPPAPLRASLMQVLCAAGSQQGLLGAGPEQYAARAASAFPFLHPDKRAPAARPLHSSCCCQDKSPAGSCCSHVVLASRAKAVPLAAQPPCLQPHVWSLSLWPCKGLHSTALNLHTTHGASADTDSVMPWKG